MKLDIIFRSCSTSSQKRYVESSKGELSLTCLNSLIQSANYAKNHLPTISIQLHILDDHSEKPFIASIKTLLKQADFESKIATIPGAGQSASMKYSCLYAQKYCHNLIYFVEDDYLHIESSILEMIDAYTEFSSKLNREVIISPCDHATEYRPPDINTRGPSHIVLGMYRHWRQIYGTTSTYLISRAILNVYKDIYMAHASYDPNNPNNTISENTTINLIYRQEFCFSPIPSLTAHVSHMDLQPPFFDYQSIWKKYNVPYSP